MKARKTIVSVDADLQDYKAKTNARLDKAAKVAKAQGAEIEGIKARLEVLEHANTKTAPAKNQPKAETGKAKKSETKAPAKAKAKTSRKVTYAYHGKKVIIDETKFDRKSYLAIAESSGWTYVNYKGETCVDKAHRLDCYAAIGCLKEVDF